MDKGRFYFISDEFYKRFDSERKLMQNKENIDGVSNGRPCFMAFPDDKNEMIFWCIPISSKVEKYHKIVEHKAQLRIDRNLPPRECDSIRFGEILGQERAFLIQNIFPITEKYIDGKYWDKTCNQEVRIAQNAEQDLIDRAKKVLKLHRRGINLIFTDIESIYHGLEVELASRTAVLTAARSNQANSVVSQGQAAPETAEKRPSLLSEINRLKSEQKPREPEQPPHNSRGKGDPDR